MGLIALTLPTAGATLNNVADPELVTALTTVQTVINGNLDTTNLAPAAGITAAQIASGAWTALTLAGSVGTGVGAYTPSARIEPGGSVRLKGVMLNNTGGTINAGVTWATIPASPAGMRPANTLTLVAQSSPGATNVVTITITTAGVITCSINVANGSAVTLDGITFTTS